MLYILQDFKHSLKTSLKNPALTILVILTLAIGIGANTAVFSLIYGILVRPFPYFEPDRLVRLKTIKANKDASLSDNSLLDVEDLKKFSDTLIDLGAYTEFDSDIRGNGTSEPVKISQLNAGALNLLGVKPVVGRLFLPEEDMPGGDVHKAIISYHLWQTRYGSNPDVIGSTIETSINSFTIIGVMPPGFKFPEQTQIWSPMESWYAKAVGEGGKKRRDSRFYKVIARLKPSIKLAQAESDLNRVAALLEKEYPKENSGIRFKLFTLRDSEVGNIRPYLILLFVASVFVLLVCCVNVANLLLSRAMTRQREFAIRASLGASRTRLIQIMLVESTLLAFLGNVLGIILAYIGVKFLLTLIPITLPFWMKIAVDLPILLFNIICTLLTGIACGLTPALISSKTDLNSLLKEDTRSASSNSVVRNILVIAEVSICLMLLVGASLMMRSFLNLQRVETGFSKENLLVVRVTNYHSGTRLEKAIASSQFHENVVNQLSALPGVIGTGATNSLPFGYLRDERFKAELKIKGKSEEETKPPLPMAGADVSSSYMSAMKIPLKSGRFFDARDTPTSEMVMIISERAAQLLFPGEDPIGKQILWGAASTENPFCTVVGVVGNVKQQSKELDNGLELYYPYTQYPVLNVYYVLRTKNNPTSLIPSVRQVINRIDPNAAIVFNKTMDELIGETLWQERLWGFLFALFASVAMLLAALGIYGVISYSINQRTRELGIRIALGAQNKDLLGLIIKEGMKVVFYGIFIGLLLSVLLARLLSSLLFGVAANDPISYFVICLTLVSIAFLACLLPALRVLKLDPITALRCD